MDVGLIERENNFCVLFGSLFLFLSSLLLLNCSYLIDGPKIDQTYFVPTGRTSLLTNIFPFKVETTKST